MLASLFVAAAEWRPTTRVILADDAGDLGLCKATLAHQWISLRARLGGNPQLSLAPVLRPIPDHVIVCFLDRLVRAAAWVRAVGGIPRALLRHIRNRSVYVSLRRLVRWTKSSDPL
jgi:hypothetical protein